MAGPDDGGVATAAVADAADASGGTNTPLDQARSAAANDEHYVTHHPAGGAGGSGADAGGEHHSSSAPQHPHQPPHQQPQTQLHNGGGEGVQPQTHLSETAPSWSAADERHRIAHAHEEATARVADAMLRGRAGTPVETQITSDEEAGTSSDDEQGGGNNGNGNGNGGTNQGQQNNNNQQQQGGEQLLAAKALAAVAATAGVRPTKQQQQQHQQLNMAGVHRSRAGSTASSTAGSGMGIGMAAAAEEMSVVLPEELRSVLEEVARSGRSNQLPWTIDADVAEADTPMERATCALEKGVKTEDTAVPLPFCGIESRRKRKRLPHTSTADTIMKGQGEDGFGSSPSVGRKRPRPAPGSDLAGERICHENDENDDTAKEPIPPQFRTLRHVLQVSLALVLDGAYRVCSERSGIGYRACQAEREAWDRKRSGGIADTNPESSTDNLGDGAANGSHAAMENGSSSSNGIVGIGPARPVEAMEDDEEKKASVVSPADLGKEMYLDRRAKLLEMLNVEQDGPRGGKKRRGAIVPPEEYGPVEPPFTIQRICEILVAPTKYYSQTHKLCNALEKLLLITSPEDSFGGGAGAAGEDEEEGRYNSGFIPEEEDLDLRKIVGRDSPTKIGGDTADTELPLQFSSQQHNEEYRRNIQEQRQNQSAALTSAASSGLNDRFAFASSSSGSPGSQGLNIDRDSHLANIGGGEHVGAEASTLDARSEQELRQTISSSLEGAGTEIAPGHLIARAPSPVLFANGTNSSASTNHRVIGMRGERLGEASAAAARQQGSSGMRERSGSVEAAESIDFMVASRSRATALQRQQDRGAPDTAALRDVDGQTGHLSASNSEDGDVDDSMESGDDLSIDDSASDRSDRSDRSDGADSDTGSHIPSVASGAGLPGTGLSVAAMGTNLHAVGTSAPAPYGYEPFAAARVLALNRIHQQQQRQEQFLQSRALAAVAAGAHAAASVANAPPGVGQQGGLGSSIGLGAAQQHQHLGVHNFRPPPDSEYQSGDSIDSTRAEDSCESDSSASDMND